MHKQVVIFGGGLAGLSAAVQSIEQQWRPIILESSGSVGGRARSFFARDISTTIDNGQHAFSPAYHKTLEFLKQIDRQMPIDFQERLLVNYYFRDASVFRFRAARLPAPFHFLLPLLRQAPLTMREKLRLAGLGKRLYLTPQETLERLSVKEWLYDQRAVDRTYKLLWEPLTLATLNTCPDQACAALLHRVLRDAFMKSARMSGLGLSGVPLSNIFAEPATSFIKKNGGQVLVHHRVSEVRIAGNQPVEVICQNGRTVSADAIISCLPPYALDRVLQQSQLLPEVLATLPEFRYSPIITINIWTRKPLPFEFPAAFVDSTLQWLFRLPFDKSANQFGYTIVISAADQLVSKTPQAIMESAIGELETFSKQEINLSADIVQWKVIKEKKATFVQSPQAESLRPGPATSLDNFYLAGDWTDTGLPATIEGAVISGKAAVAQMIASYCE